MKYTSGILTTRKVSTRQRGGVAARDRLGSMEQESEDSLSELHAKVECKLKTACLFFFNLI